jgi:hypothetical protein
MEVKNLSLENVWDLSEEQAFHVFQEIQNESEKERRSQYLKIIDTAFELRSLSRSKSQSDAKLIVICSIFIFL